MINIYTYLVTKVILHKQNRTKMSHAKAKREMFQLLTLNILVININGEALNLILKN